MFRCLPAAIAVIMLAAPVFGQSSKAVDIIPDDALGFLLIKDLSDLSSRVDNLARKLKVEEKTSLLELIEKEMGIREGLNAKGPAIFMVLPSEKNHTEFVLALPVSDHEKVAKQLGLKAPPETIAQGEVGSASGLLAGIGGNAPKDAPTKFPVLVAKKNAFVLLAAPNGRAGLEAILNSKKSIGKSIEPVRDWLEKQDMAGVCTPSGIHMGLAMFLGGPGGSVESSSPGQFAHMKATFAEVEKNVKLIAFGGQIEKEGNTRLSTAIHFDPNGDYAKWIAKAETIDRKLLSRLPDQPQFVTALARISAQTTFEGGIRFLMGDLPADKIEPLTKEFGKLVQQVSEVAICVYGGKSYKTVMPRTGSEISGEPIFLAQVKDANTFLDNAVDFLKHSHRAARSASKTKTEINYREKDIAGKPARLITVGNADAEKGKENAQVFLLAALDRQTVMACFLTDESNAEAMITKYSKGSDHPLSENATLKKTQSLLPDKLQLEVFLNLQAFNILGEDKKMPDVAPLGFSMRTIPAGLEAQFVIPFDALQAVFNASKAKKE